MVSMTETPSGNRWEPGPSSGPRPESPAPLPPSYDVPVTAADGTRGRRRGLLVAGVALVVLASGATGYAIGTSGDGTGHDQVTRQGPPPGSDDGAGFDRDGDDDGPPGTENGAG